ncbi:MAG: hypothetical protein ACE5HY_04150 [Candidatus Hydrothermarchaeales archaeon]
MNGKDNIKLISGLTLDRSEATRFLMMVDKLNPNFTIPKKRMAPSLFLFFLSPLFVAYYIVTRESVVLLFVGLFSAISGLHGLQKVFELSRDLRELKSRVGEDKLGDIVAVVRRFVEHEA